MLKFENLVLKRWFFSKSNQDFFYLLSSPFPPYFVLPIFLSLNFTNDFVCLPFCSSSHSRALIYHFSSFFFLPFIHCMYYVMFLGSKILRLRIENCIWEGRGGRRESEQLGALPILYRGSQLCASKSRRVLLSPKVNRLSEEDIKRIFDCTLTRVVFMCVKVLTNCSNCQPMVS